ncbi:MAG: AI-2E family transporter [Bacteroidia bacterium]
MNQLKNLSHFFIASFAIVVILIYGQSLLIPLVISFLLWFIIKQIRSFIELVPIIQKKVPMWLKNLFSTAILLVAINTLLSIVLHNVKLMSGSYQKYQQNTDVILAKLNQEISPELLQKISEFFLNFDFANALISFFDYSTAILINVFLVIVYVLFFILEEYTFLQKLKMIFPNQEKQSTVLVTLKEIESSISKYLGLKTLMSLVTGALSYLVLWIMGVDFPVFWSFVIFLMHYIPNVGSLIATLFPAIFSMLQFGTILPGIWVFFWISSIEFLVGNLLEPKLMGNSVNLSPLIILLSLSFWGSIWGITGMLLSVPIMAIIVIILSKFPKTKPIAILLSANGIPEK